MKFGDICKSVLILLIFALLYFSAILAMGMQKLKDDWPKYRCVPTMMPFAGYLGQDTMTNFVYCIGNIQKDMMGYFLEPIMYVLGMVGGIGEWILERIQFIRLFFEKFKGLIMGIIGDVYAMFVNILIQFQKLIMTMKDTMMKTMGILITFLYLIQGAMLTGQSLNAGPIGKTLRTICFSKNTPIKLINGKTIKMKDIHLGDILENGSEVYGLLKLKGDRLNPFYKLWSYKLNDYIYVTGDHKICNSIKYNLKYTDDLKNYIEVKNYHGTELTEYFDEELSCLITSNHKIPVGEYTFWDWED